MRARILLAFALVIAVTLIAVAFFAQQAATQEVRTFIGRGGAMGAENLVSALETYYETNGSWNGAGSLFSARGHGQGMGPGNPNSSASVNAFANLRLAALDGSIIYSSNEAEINSIASSDQLSNGIDLVVVDNVVGYLLPESGSSFQNQQLEDAIIAQVRQASIKAAWIAGAIALVLALFLATIILRPIRQLTRAASELAQGNLAYRVEVKQPHELAALGNAFNQMAYSLEAAGENRKAMTADIAHELRTPLAVQRAQLEALQDGIYPLTQENIEPLLAQNIFLTHLVNDLRTLAMADSGALRLEMKEIDFVQFVQDTILRFQAPASERQINLNLKTQFDQVLIFADPERLQQVLHNIIQNGLRYTAAGGYIDFNISSTAQKVILEIHDSGAGIPEEALPHLFERFYRADKARDRDRGGSGLGLAIARQLMISQGGNIEAENHPESGALFRLWLPVKPVEIHKISRSSG
jgi:signal transduction histidine kinase